MMPTVTAVIAGGGGMVVLEDMEHALARGATIHAEIVGYGANSDGHDMVAPSGEGAMRCWNCAPALTARPLPTKLTISMPAAHQHRW